MKGMLASSAYMAKCSGYSAAHTAGHGSYMIPVTVDKLMILTDTFQGCSATLGTDDLIMTL